MWHILLFIKWNPNPNVWHLFIKWYGVLWGLSVFSCFYIAGYVFRKSGKDDEKVSTIILYAFILGVIGARLAHIVFYGLGYYAQNPSEIPAIWKGGLASHGGIIGAILGLYIFCKRNKEFNFFWLFDHVVICVLLLASLIRLGNLMNSELYGTPTNVPWAFIFEAVDNIPRHPVVLYESIAYLIIQFLMLYLFNKYRESKPGLYLVVFLVLVFSVRFLLEFFKEPDGGLILGIISKTQLLNLPFIAAGFILFYFVKRGKLKYPAIPVIANGKV